MSSRSFAPNGVRGAWHHSVAAPASAIAAIVAGGTAAPPAARADNGTANITFQWTDRVGNTHPLGYAWTDGYYNTSLSSGNSGGPPGFLPGSGVAVYTGWALFGNLDFYGNLYTSFGVGSVEWFRILDGSNSMYSQRWPSSGFFTTTGPQGDNFTHTVDNTTYQGAAYGIGQALMFADRYAGFRLNASAPFFSVGYHSGTTGSFYVPNGPVPGNSYLQIDRADWASWDVILHEFGHHVAYWNNLDLSPGGPHGFGGDNIRGTDRPPYPPNPGGGVGLGPVQGSRLAWSEGFATYFGLSAIRSGNLQAAIPGLPADDYDDWYADYDATGSQALDYQHLNFAVHAERPRLFFGGVGGGGNGGTFADGVRRGEGDEYSVLLAMWDYYDHTNEAFNTSAVYHPKTQRWCSDRVNYGDVDAWNRVITANGGAKTFRDYWVNLVADAATATGRGKINGLATNRLDEAVAALGETLEAAGIACVPVSPDGDSAPLNTLRPTFQFQEQNNSNSDYFRVLVFSLDWSTIVFGSPIINDVDFGLDLVSFTPATDIPMGTYWWVALNSPAIAALADVTGNANRYNMYWSGARQFTLVPAPSALALLGAAGLLAARRRRPAIAAAHPASTAAAPPGAGTILALN
jgi:hypothetical protein